MENIQHVGVLKLEGSKNWNVWKLQMKVLLRGQEWLDNGWIIENHGEQTAWANKDAKAQSLIVTRMTDDVMLHIISCSTSAEIWRKLLSVHEQKTETSNHIVQQRFFQYKYDKAADMSVFLLLIKNPRIAVSIEANG
ncbi:unnamed protein product [Danaus chrysippus]|uniref:(African queen) hypothetical protein n=1 Tax=Danaus chrysippus TaxID=151541 RepID=A0A8J2VZW2_9NEOP|nr:unnamed protein product [Danaus chrysippus]